ncbi:hypothetical protein MPSEU_000110500 [Mayamaea pseudoterrestris]|nr:hypothetical protein MPSEU_000110500 [Mayamaea pseudoterrestris]
MSSLSLLDRFNKNFLSREIPFWNVNAVDGAAANARSKRRHHVPANLDIHYVTDNLLAASAPHSPLETRTFLDTGRDEAKKTNAKTECHKSDDDCDDESLCVEQLQHEPEEHAKTTTLYNHERRNGNSAAAFASFLDANYANKYMIFMLGPAPPDDLTLLLLRRQIVQLDSHQQQQANKNKSPAIYRQQKLLDACYALHAWLSADASHVAVVCCPNGRTHTAIVLAAYLKYMDQVETMHDGFCHVVQCILKLPSDTQHDERNDSSATNSIHGILQQLPASLHQAFRNMDKLIEYGECIQSRPLLLRAIALQGVPVECAPLLQLYDASGTNDNAHQQGHLVYSSSQNSEKVQWVDDEGFYLVNCVVQGEFRLECRFGDAFNHNDEVDDDYNDAEEESNDISKILFLFMHSTGFLGAGTYELTLDEIDVPPRYRPYFDEDDFILTLVFESDWSCTRNDANDEESKLMSLIQQDCPESILPYVLYDMEAVQQGWWIIHTLHSARPADEDIDRFLADLRTTPNAPAWALSGQAQRHLVALALQLYNFHWSRTREALLIGDFCKWWNLHGSDEGLSTTGDDHDITNADIMVDRDSQIKESPISLPYGSSVMNPRPGDILHSLESVEIRDLLLNSNTGNGKFQPAFRYISKKNQASVLSPSLMDDPRNQDAVACFLQLDHLEVDLQDLINLKEASRFWNTGTLPQQPAVDTSDMADSRGSLQGQATDEMSSSVNHPSLIENYSKGVTEPEEDENGNVDAIPSEPSLADDPKFAKYFRMLKTGLPPTVVRHALQRDGLDPSILDFDPTRSYVSQVNDMTSTEDLKTTLVQTDEPETLPLKDDPTYSKYFRMLDKGIPEGAVRNALRRDGYEESILALDRTKTYASQKQVAIKESKQEEQALKDDPTYAKYFDMLSKGLPEGAVRNALLRAGHDPSILDLNPTKSYASQTSNKVDSQGELALKDDPAYAKYFDMLSKGLPEGAVRNALQRDGREVSILDMDPTKSYASQTCNIVDAQAELTLKDDPAYAKYFDMLSKGLPKGAVQNALQRDGLDITILDMDPTKSYASQSNLNKGAVVSGPPLKDDPTYAKYFRMLDKGLPRGAVQNAVKRDGHDCSVLDLDPNKPLNSQQKSSSTDKKANDIALKNDPEWKKYYSMLAMGLPLGAVKNAVTRDGKDPAVLDLDPQLSLEMQMPTGRRTSSSQKAKKLVRRKKIFWKPIDPRHIKDDSLWSLVKDMDSLKMSSLKYDEKEFADLFTQSTEPGAQAQRKAPSTPTKMKKAVQVIDGKRSMNGGIVLLRLKMDCNKIAQLVDSMEHGGLDPTQLTALKEFLPTEDERNALRSYMNSNGDSETEQKAAITILSECEKYMLTMLDISDASAKIDCILFRVQFKQRLDEFVRAIQVLDKACKEVVSSARLRKLLAMILTLVNQINTGGDGGDEIGFSLEALLKLNEAKAFDRKTTVLQYLYRLVKDNDSELCNFGDDLPHTKDACDVVFENILSEMQQLEAELMHVKKTAKEQADAMEARGETQKVTLAELREQRSTIHSVEQVPQYNQAELIGGRTSMERFVRHAESILKESVAYYSEVQENYQKLLDYICEDEKMRANEFFVTMRRFILAFYKAGEVVENEERLRVREQKRTNPTITTTPSVTSVAGDIRSDKGLLAAIATSATKKSSAIVTTPAAECSTGQIAATHNRSGTSQKSKSLSNDHAVAPSAFAAIAASASTKRETTCDNPLAEEASTHAITIAVHNGLTPSIVTTASNVDKSYDVINNSSSTDQMKDASELGNDDEHGEFRAVASPSSVQVATSADGGFKLVDGERSALANAIDDTAQLEQATLIGSLPCSDNSMEPDSDDVGRAMNEADRLEARPDGTEDAKSWERQGSRLQRLNTNDNSSVSASVDVIGQPHDDHFSATARSSLRSASDNDEDNEPVDADFFDAASTHKDKTSMHLNEAAWQESFSSSSDEFHEATS